MEVGASEGVEEGKEKGRKRGKEQKEEYWEEGKLIAFMAPTMCHTPY